MGFKHSLLDTWHNLLPTIQRLITTFKEYLLKVRDQWTDLGSWKYLLILLSVVLLLVFLPDSTPTPPSVAPVPIPEPPIFETKGFQRIALFASAALLLWLVLVIFYDVGKIQLSAQTVGHRRNVLLALSIILLAEVFEVNIAEMLSLNVEEPSTASEEAGTATSKNTESINLYAFGVLGFFAVYSFIEYAFTFVSDYLRSRSEWKKNGGNSHSVGAAVFVVGMYRSLFDILLPSLAVVFVILYYSSQTRAFVDRMATELFCGHVKLAEKPKQFRSQVLNSLSEVETMCPKCSYAVADLRDSFGMVDAYASAKFSWKAMECKPDG